MALLQQEKGLVTDLFKNWESISTKSDRRSEWPLKRPRSVMKGADICYSQDPVALAPAEAEAKRLKDEFTGTEHLLIAMSSEPRGKPRVYQECGTTRRRSIALFRRLEPPGDDARAEANTALCEKYSHDLIIGMVSSIRSSAARMKLNVLCRY
jgi:ATP-dependent Clp protease ATP-binding subunit ClpC